MAGVSLECRDCGAQLRSVEEAQEHAELTKHTDFAESTTPVLHLVCDACGKPCRSETEKELHTKRTGHAQFSDKTAEAAKPVVLETKPSAAATHGGAMVDVSEESKGESEDLVVPEVNKDLLAEMESMGFPVARAIRALHFSKSSTIEQAVNWIVDHEEDPDIDELPKVPVSKPDAVAAPALTAEEVKMKAQALIEKARKKKDEEEKRSEREREKERIRIGKELLEAKRIEEDNERKRIIALRKAEKEEEKRARERIRQKLEEDKAERRRKLGLPAEEPKAAEAPEPAVEKETKKSTLPVRPATKAEQMRDCLRSMKQNHKEDDAKVKKAFQTLLTYVGNIARSPGEEMYRKIRLLNPSFHERVGSLDGGIRFLEICGFEKDAKSEFITLASSKVDLNLLNAAGAELNSAILNPFFGVL